MVPSGKFFGRTDFLPRTCRFTLTFEEESAVFEAHCQSCMARCWRPDPWDRAMPRSLEEEAGSEVMTSLCMSLNSLAVEEPITAHMVSSFEMEEFCNLGDASGDEATLALIDTACTACMRSMNWRLAFSKQLPESVRYEPLQLFKTFHFANGSSTASQIQVWEIPICLCGRPGEVHSAEVPEGNTPLLLSISALESLNAIIFMKEKCIKLQELGIALPWSTTRTRHLAIDVSL